MYIHVILLQVYHEKNRVNHIDYVVTLKNLDLVDFKTRIGGIMASLLASSEVGPRLEHY